MKRRWWAETHVATASGLRTRAAVEAMRVEVSRLPDRARHAPPSVDATSRAAFDAFRRASLLARGVKP